ncbi:MAG TPA: ferritin-like domain-containing protein, partial [Polyangia bacterium]
MNRTGIKTSPLDSIAAEAAAGQGTPSSLGDSGIAQVRLELAREGVPVGSMPPPASLKGLAKSAVTLLKGESPTLFLNLLGER